MDDPPSMRNPSENEQNKCSSIKEGDTVNLYVTFPGAIMALTMIHLQSNNSKIASQLSLPDTFYLLESARPLEVMLKCLCRNLIMWDQIECTEAWVKAQIPEIIYQVMFSDKESIEFQF